MNYDGWDPTDPDMPLQEDIDRQEIDETILCPDCGREIHADAAICPYCHQWIIDESPAARRARGWFYPVIVALLVAVILVIWHGLFR